MIISLIAAFGRNQVIGKNSLLPWRRQLPADMRRFRDLTIGKPVIMGRKTLHAIITESGKSLPNRLNIVLSRGHFFAPGCVVAHSIEKALELASACPRHDEVMVIGGAEVFAQFLPRADRLYLTLIDAEFEGDTFFPKGIGLGEWKIVERKVHEPDKRNKFRYTFLVLERRVSKNPDDAKA